MKLYKHVAQVKEPRFLRLLIMGVSCVAYCTRVSGIAFSQQVRCYYMIRQRRAWRSGAKFHTEHIMAGREHSDSVSDHKDSITLHVVNVLV